MAVPAADIGWTPDRSAGGRYGPWVLACVISLPTFMFALDASIATVALNHIAGALGASYSEATWVITGYLIAAGLAVPVSGWLSQAIGRKRYYLVCVTIFALASLLCGLVNSLPLLVAARILQGLGGGGMQPSERSMLVDSFPPSKLAAAFGVYGVVALMGPVIGPVVGGFVTEHFDWRWLFLMNVPIGIIATLLIALVVDETDAVREDRAKIWRGEVKIDVVGFWLVIVGIASFEFGLDQGQRLGWFDNGFIVGCFGVAAVALTIFVFWELRHPEPILDLRLFRHRNLATATIIDALAGVVIYGSSQFLPQLLQQTLGYSAFDAGLTMGAGAIAMLVMMPVAAILADRVSGRVMVAGALIAMGLSILPMTGLNTELTFQHAAWLRLWQSIALPFLFIPISAIALVGVPSGKSGQGSALLELCTSLGGSLSITLAQVLLYQRSQFHQSRLVEHLTPANLNYVEGARQLANQLAAHGMTHAAALQQAAGLYFAAAQRQASMMAFVDVAWVLTGTVIVVLPSLLLLRSERPRIQPEVVRG